jgi:hypothetical protein
VLFPVPQNKPIHTPDLPVDDGAPVRPIGPERLRALREAILSGAYPLDAAVESGLTQLFREGSPRSASAKHPPTEPA